MEQKPKWGGALKQKPLIKLKMHAKHQKSG